MTIITLTLRDSQTGESGQLDWDPDNGSVNGFRAEKITFYGDVPWCHAGSGIGDGKRPAIRSIDGMVAMLMMLGYDPPPELQVEIVPIDDLPFDAIN